MDIEVDLATMDGLDNSEFVETNFDPELFFIFDTYDLENANSEFDAFEDAWLQSFLDNAQQGVTDNVEVDKALYIVGDNGISDTDPFFDIIGNGFDSPFEGLSFLGLNFLTSDDNGPGGANYEIIVTGTTSDDNISTFFIISLFGVSSVTIDWDDVIEIANGTMVLGGSIAAIGLLDGPIPDGEVVGAVVFLSGGVLYGIGTIGSWFS